MKSIHKEYDTGEVVTTVLKNIDFQVRSGEFIAIMGPSGAGKSTFMNIVSFLDRPSSGKYLFNGTDTETYTDNQLADIRNQKIGFVFQMFNLLPNLTAIDNVKLPLIYADDSNVNQEKRAKAALTQVGLEHRFKHRPNQLSGGEQQRIAIARALINNPTIIFADEPTGNLDSKSAYEIMNILGKLRKKSQTTIFMVTHEPDIAEYAERIITMRDGNIVEDIPNTNPRLSE